MKKSLREVFLNFRPLGALTGPRERQKATQDGKPVMGKGSGPLEGDVMEKSLRRGSGDGEGVKRSRDQSST
eukprot:5927414-Pyramimonas_sp.AAC.1